MDTDGNYRRRKQPELVRRALLDEAAKLATEGGLASITVQAVADAAGVTKGGFIHHFPSKQALIDTLCQELLDSINADLDRHVADDPVPYGSFTRAYLATVFDAGDVGKYSAWATLSISMLTDANLRKRWTSWFAERTERHEGTDADVSLRIVRLAADGIWIADLFNLQSGDRQAIHQALLTSTYPKT